MLLPDTVALKVPQESVSDQVIPIVSAEPLMVPEIDPLECVHDAVPFEQVNVPEMFDPDWDRVRDIFINAPERLLVAVPVHVPETVKLEDDVSEPSPPQP